MVGVASSTREGGLLRPEPENVQHSALPAPQLVDPRSDRLGQDDGAVEVVEDAPNVLRIARQVPQRRWVRARTGQLVHDRHPMAGLLQTLGDAVPDPAAVPSAMDEEV
jgi:hypothetical protein